MVVVLQETKRRALDDKLLSFLWGKKENAWCELPAVGALEGVALIRDTSRVKVLIHMLEHFQSQSFAGWKVWMSTSVSQECPVNEVLKSILKPGLK